MKNKLCLIGCLTAHFATAQIAYKDSTFVVNNDFDLTYKKLVRAAPGSVLKIHSRDTLFILSKQRYEIYEKVVEAFKNDDCYKMMDDVLNTYDKTLIQLSQQYQNLHQNASSTDSLGQQFIDSTRAVIRTSLQSLNRADAQLQAAQNHLNKAVEYIDKAKNQKWLWIGVGAAGGLLVGILLTR
jgi:ElaB/YqjD/DUF883 family membrane-anchored ribosome-binding protein